jgi:type VI secretion system protein VasJ
MNPISFKTPVALAVPPGVDLAEAEDAGYDAIESEFAKFGDGRPCDWASIRDNARAILEARSRHLKVAAWYTIAGAKLDRWAGLLDGLQTLESLLNDAWDQLQPRPSRRNAIWEYLDQNLAKVINGLGLGRGLESDPCLAALLRVDKAAMARSMPALNAALSAIQTPAGAASRVQSPAGGTNPAVAPASAPEPEIKDAAAAQRAFRDARTRLGQISSALLEANPRQPLPYRINRFTSWAEVTRIGGDQSGKTQVPGPSKEDADRILAALQPAADLDVLRRIEKRCRDYPLWLDLQHRVVLTLEALGADFREAADTVRSEVCGLLERLPPLPKLLFASGVPFASPGAGAYFAKRDSVAAEPPPTPAVRTEQTGVPAPLEVIGQQFTAGKITEAFATFQSAVQIGGGRDRFVLRLEFARLLCGRKMTEAAYAHIQLLRDQIEKQNLENWEPELCVSVYMAAVRVIQSIPVPTVKSAQSHEFGGDMRDYRAKLWQLDAAAGFLLDKK